MQQLALAVGCEKWKKEKLFVEDEFSDEQVDAVAPRVQGTKSPSDRA